MARNADTHAFLTLLETVEAATKSLRFKSHETPWYRGQQKAEYDLLPSLFRSETLKAYAKSFDQRMPSNDAHRHEMIMRLESDVYFEFASHSSHLEDSPRSAWDILFLMRHYGLPSRVLDWSECLGVAVHFATMGQPNKMNSALWILNPYAMNEISWKSRDTVLPQYLIEVLRGPSKLHDTRRHPEVMIGRDYDRVLAGWQHDSFKFDAPVAVHPNRRNERMHAQQGVFTVHGNTWAPLNKQASVRNCWKKVEIGPRARRGALEFLKNAGIDERRLFPGLDGLSRAMKRRYGG